MTATRTRILLAAVTIGAFLGAVFGSAPAHADTTDQDNEFLQSMDRDGIVYNAPQSGAIAAAHFFCAARGAGNTEADVARYVYLNSGLSAEHSVDLVRDAERVYCPNYLGGTTV